jgi:hypothetical protein
MIALGSTWKRRVLPATPDEWERVTVTGIFEQEITEVCVRPADCFGPVISCPAADLEAAYDLETEPTIAPEMVALEEWC